MFGNDQTQKSGDNSQQIQANTINYIFGIDEKRAREICNEVFEVKRREMTDEAWQCAISRAKQLENRLIPKLLEIDGAINYFADPEFQLLLSNAQKSAAVSNQESDYNLLAELLKCHIEKGKTRKTRVGISGAVEIVNKIDDDALCGLTVIFFLYNYVVTKPLCRDGLSYLANTFDKLLYTELPKGESWLDHLDILKAIRINNVLSLKPFEELCPAIYDGYSAIGIEKGSDNYKKALQLLESVHLNELFLIENEHLEGYVKLPIACKSHINHINLKSNVPDDIINIDFELDKELIGIFEQIWNLYSTDGEKKIIVNEAFVADWDSYPSLKRIHDFYNGIPCTFDITHIGKTIAYTNARRCDESITEITLE